MEAFPFRFSWHTARLVMAPACTSTRYEEIFIVQKGQATFTIGDTTHFLRGGQIVIAPANTPHKFKNTGEEPLQMITIHPGQQAITEWLEN
jgi:mannose-6-phosphate isomerase-like protein (cupin superfamily)